MASARVEGHRPRSKLDEALDARRASRCSPPVALLTQLVTKNQALAADAEDRWIWNVDEMHFKVGDH